MMADEAVFGPFRRMLEAGTGDNEECDGLSRKYVNTDTGDLSDEVWTRDSQTTQGSWQHTEAYSRGWDCSTQASVMRDGSFDN